MKKCYVPKRFNPKAAQVIERANELLEYYEKHGIECTLRSLFYRFVAKNWIPNEQKAYKRLGVILGEARLAGRMRWDIMIDKTRRAVGLERFDGPQDALDRAANSYHIDMWRYQKYRPEVWIEKDAAAGNIIRACHENDVPYLSCRGYTSLTEMWKGSMRLQSYLAAGQTPFIIHIGDHDPSGIDMSRDIVDRLQKTFMADCEFKRLALNMDQITARKLPPQPGKVKDKRYKAYVLKYGKSSWEVDAIDPLEFYKMVADEIEGLKDTIQWEKDLKEEAEVKARLHTIARTWDSPTATSGPPRNLPWAGRKREETGDADSSSA